VRGSEGYEVRQEVEESHDGISITAGREIYWLAFRDGRLTRKGDEQKNRLRLTGGSWSSREDAGGSGGDGGIRHEGSSVVKESSTAWQLVQGMVSQLRTPKYEGGRKLRGMDSKGLARSRHRPSGKQTSNQGTVDFLLNRKRMLKTPIEVPVA